MTKEFAFSVPATCAHLGPGFGVLGVAVDLALAIEVESNKSQEIEIEREGVMSHQPEDARHDGILRGLHAAKAKFGIKMPPGLRIHARNEIPAFAGLGTNTAAFAAGIGIAIRFASTMPDAEAVINLLVELGGVPAHGGAALYGGLVAACPVQTAKDSTRHFAVRYALDDCWHFVIAHPDHRLGASDAVRVLPANLPHGVTKRNSGRLLGLLHALSVGDQSLLRDCLVDEQHVPYRRRLVPGVDEALRAAEASGIARATICGAGPALVLIASTEEVAKDGGAAMLAAFTAAGVPTHVLHLRSTAVGAIPDDSKTA